LAGKLARDKHSSLLRKSVNYDRKKFYSTGPWGFCYKTFTEVTNNEVLAIASQFQPSLIFVAGQGKPFQMVEFTSYPKICYQEEL
jgi:hypothetical protein